MTHALRAPLKPLPIEVEPYEMHDYSTIGRTHYQWLYRFANGYGASVVWGDGLYSDGRIPGAVHDPATSTYEMAVIRFGTKHSDGSYDIREVIPSDDPDSWTICYTTPITDDVMGWQSLGAIATNLLSLSRIVAGQVAA